MHPVLLENIQHLGKPYADLNYLLECLSEVLEDNNEKAYIPFIPWLNVNVPLPAHDQEQKIVHLYSISFQLLNLCEVNWAVQSRRSKQQESGTQSVNGSWAQTFTELKNSGFSQGRNSRCTFTDRSRAGTDGTSNRSQADGRSEVLPRTLPTAGYARKPHIHHS